MPSAYISLDPKEHVPSLEAKRDDLEKLRQAERCGSYVTDTVEASYSWADNSFSHIEVGR